MVKASPPVIEVRRTPTIAGVIRQRRVQDHAGAAD
jgi:hypothetical protein